MMNRKLLGESLVEAGLISIEQLNNALVLKVQKFHFEKIGGVLMNLNYIDEDTLIEFLGRQYGTSGINFSKKEADKKAVHTLPWEVAEKYRAIPVGFKTDKKKTKLIVAMANPSNLEAIDMIAFISGYEIEPVFAREEDLKWVIRENYYYNKRIHSQS
jgi:type IV pilus assembly protein PilB